MIRILQVVEVELQQQQQQQQQFSEVHAAAAAAEADMCCERDRRVSAFKCNNFTIGLQIQNQIQI